MTASGGEQREVSACPICGGAELRPHVTLRAGTRVLSCAGCTNGVTVPTPEAAYDDHPFYSHVHESEPRWRGYSRQVAQFLARHGRTSGRLLDVGCSHGLLLEEAQQIGLEAEGIEPSRAAVEHCRRRGLAVRHGYLEPGAYPPGSFDVVVMSHVVEHVRDAEGLVRTAGALLAPDGVLCLCQTNYTGTLARWLGRRWDYWVEHEHYYHFSPRGIEVLLRRAGLRRVTLELLPLGYHWDFARSSGRSLRGIAANTLNCAVSGLQLGLPYEGDQMYVLAERGA